jgi:uncharacterized membrane protein YraQ (UPF0718 family)
VLALALVLSVVGLAEGPALVALGRGRAVPSAAVEGLTLGLVPVLIVVRLVPHVYEEIGPSALALLAVGYGALWAADRWGHRTGARIGQAVIVPTLAVHALTDGAGLAVAVASGEEGHGAGVLLGAALLLHRLPEGLFLASTLVPALGWRRTLNRLALVAAATVFGALAGRTLLAHVPDALFDAVVALGLGAMLRLVVHSHVPAPRTPGARAVGGAAFALGLLAALAIPAPDSVLQRAQPRELSLVQSLGPLFIETAPAMLLGLFVVGLWQAFLPRSAGAGRGMRVGLPLTACSCESLPLARRLLRGGAPAAVVIALARSAPELGVDSALLSLRLLGLPLTAARLVASVLLALAMALLVTRVARASSSDPSQAEHSHPHLRRPAAGLGGRLRHAVVEGFGPTLDHVAAWYLAGLVLAAAFEAAVDPALVARLGAPFDVVLSALVAIPVYICAQGATPMAAVMVHKGFSVGAALAFLLIGPGINLAALALLRRMLGLRAAAAFALGSVACAVIAGVVVNALVDRRSLPEIHPLVAHQHAWIEWVCAAALAGLILASVLRLGPRGWFATMAPDGEEPHAHAHPHAPAASAPRVASVG